MLFSRIGGGSEGLLLIMFAFRLRSLPSFLVVSSFFLPVVRFLGVLGGAHVYACLQKWKSRRACGCGQ